jgi:hypothetical protein
VLGAGMGALMRFPSINTTVLHMIMMCVRWLASHPNR